MTCICSQVYVSYLFFQLFSHKSLYDDKNEIKPATVAYAPRTGPSARERTKKFLKLSTVKEVKEDRASVEESADSNSHLVRSHPNDDSRRLTDEERRGTIQSEDDEEDEEIPELSLPMTIGLLVVVTVFVAVTAEWLVGSIDGLASGGGISKEFIGLILLPIVGNAAEHATAVTVSVKDKLTLSLGVAVGSSIVSSPSTPYPSTTNLLSSLQQIALFVIPFIIVLGWIIGRPITMLFDPFESIVLFFSVLTVNYVVQDGRSNWLEGMILICLCVQTFFFSLPRRLTYATFERRYIIVALVFWFYPGTQLDGLLTCSA